MNPFIERIETVLKLLTLQEKQDIIDDMYIVNILPDKNHGENEEETNGILRTGFEGVGTVKAINVYLPERLNGQPLPVEPDLDAPNEYIEQIIRNANTDQKKRDLIDELFRDKYLSRLQTHDAIDSIHQRAMDRLRKILRFGLNNKEGHFVVSQKSVPVRHSGQGGFNALIFIRGHSKIDSHKTSFKIQNLKTSTILLATPGTSAISYSTMNEVIRSYAIKKSVMRKQAGTLLQEIKDELRLLPTSERMHSYINEGGIISELTSKFYDRRWRFFDRYETGNIKRGFIYIVVNIDGKISFFEPYNDRIDAATFTLTKQVLLNDTMTKLKQGDKQINIGIIDFGCAKWDLTTLPAKKKRYIEEGKRFGGTRKIK